MSSIVKEPTTVSKRPTPLGTLIDEIWAHREIKRGLEDQIKKIEETIANAEAALLERLDAEGVDKSSGKKASVSIKESQTYSPEGPNGWDLFMAFVAKTKQFHLVQKRPAQLAVDELFEKKGGIPGLSRFKKRSINIRTIPTSV